MEEALAELERLAAWSKTNAAERDAIDAAISAFIDRLMAGDPEERQMARRALANFEEGLAADIANAQHLREALQNRVDDGFL
jgi:hypothetical protein